MPDAPEVIIEIATLGHFVKITAIDAASGVEVSTIAPTLLSKIEMEQLAIKKLLYVLQKKGKKYSPDND